MRSHYARLGLNLVLSTLIMYLVMFAMIDGIGDFYNNLNMFYMALMMVAPMAMLMLLMMGSMYDNRRLNLFLHAFFAGLFIAAFTLTRAQGAVGNEQFLRSMIPHHSGAILMCQQAAIEDPEIATLCRDIVVGQQAEIEQMQALLDR